MAFIKNGIAFVRGNVKCAVHKMLHMKSFRFSPFLRMYDGVTVSQRNKGEIRFGKNLKIDSRALLSANGGKIVLGDGVGIGRDGILVSQEEISVGKGTIFGPNVLIYDHDHKFDPNEGVSVTEYHCDKVSIGENCWIGANTVILKGTVIGDRCLIAAGSIVKGTIPDGSKVVQKRKTEIYREVQ